MVAAMHTDTPRRIGATIRAIREAKGIKLDPLASALGRSRSHLANIEAGRRVLQPEYVEPLARLLGVDPLAIADVAAADLEATA